MSSNNPSFLPPPPNTRSLAVRDLPESEQPAVRLAFYGASILSNAELLIAMLGLPTFNAANDLLRMGDGLARLSNLSIAQLTTIDGIGPNIAVRLKAAAELARRIQMSPADERPQIRSPADAADVLIPILANQPQEHVLVILLDTKNRVRRIVDLYKGSANTCLVRVAEVLRDAIVDHATGIVLGHNHPSGDPTPSPEDVVLTKSVVAGAKLLDIDVLDHIIVADNRYVSLKERGLGFD